jgi:hypothetical protein
MFKSKLHQIVHILNLLATRPCITEWNQWNLNNPHIKSQQTIKQTYINSFLATTFRLHILFARRIACFTDTLASTTLTYHWNCKWMNKNEFSKRNGMRFFSPPKFKFFVVSKKFKGSGLFWLFWPMYTFVCEYSHNITLSGK